MWIGMLWTGLPVTMWITHVGGKFRHDLLEKSLIASLFFNFLLLFCSFAGESARFKIENARSETRVFKTRRFADYSLVCDSLFGLRAKNAGAKNPLINNGMQQNAETACIWGCVLKTQRFNNTFLPI